MFFPDVGLSTSRKAYLSREAQLFSVTSRADGPRSSRKVNPDGLLRILTAGPNSPEGWSSPTRNNLPFVTAHNVRDGYCVHRQAYFVKSDGRAAHVRRTHLFLTEASGPSGF